MSLRLVGHAYVACMRGIPLLVILYLLYFALPELGVVLNATQAGILALGLVYAAYLAEVLRAGFATIAAGQREAAVAAGFTPWQAFRLILLPQVLRRVIAPLLVTLISLLKDSSVCALISVPELTLASRAIMSETFLPLHVFTLTALIYFLIAFPASRAVHSLERRLSRSSGSGTQQPTQAANDLVGIDKIAVKQ